MCLTADDVIDLLGSHMVSPRKCFNLQNIYFSDCRERPSHLYILNFFLQINDVIKKHIINHWYPTRDCLSFLQFCNMVSSTTHTCIDYLTLEFKGSLGQVL
jgi:hypothetical protein